MNFQFFRPTGILTRYVKYYWVLEALDSEGEISERVIPTGNIQLMFHFGKPFQVKSGEICIIQPRSFISGISSNFTDVSTKGETGVIAVTFLPYGACNFFKFPLLEIENTEVNLSDIYTKEFRLTEEMICAAPTLIQKIAIVEQFLLKHYFPVSLNDFSFIKYSVSAINKHKGMISASFLSNQLLVTPKSLERKFSALLGKTPKQFLKIVRFQEIIRCLSAGGNIPLTELAYEKGYFDQAHFIKDFKTLSGYTPRQFLSICPCRSDYFD